MSTPARDTASTTRDTRATSWPVVLCWIAVMLEGYDLVVLGAVIPTLIETKDLGFTPAAATEVATIGLIGVGIGALAIGPLADRYGRRVTLMGCIALFSVFTIAIAVASSVTMFGTFRFIAGLGLGGCLPIALAFMSEHAPTGKGSSATTRTMTGYHVGAVLTALIAIKVVPHWEWMFVIGGVAGLLVLPLMWARLPESEAFLLAKETKHIDRRSTAAPVAALLQGPYRRISIGIWVASFMGLLLVYGLNTWLPQIMREAGYELGAALTLLLVLNIGAVAGLLVSGRVADARGNKPSTLAWFGLAAVLLAVLSIKMDVLSVLYVVVFVTGFFVFSAQVLVYAFVGHLYPPEVRGTAIGFSSGIGRIGAIVGPTISGALVSAGIAYPWGFYVFAIAAALAVGAIAVVPAHAQGQVSPAAD